MHSKATEQLRDAGYEALFLMGGYLALSVHPTLRNLDDILRWIDETKSRRQFLRRLEKRGLVESGTRNGQWVPLLTDLGRAAFAGGRDPKEAWNRGWDGRWRLLTFDLPRKEHPARMKLARWLGRHHFGRLQGSVWISPDPVQDIGEVLSGHRIDPTKVLVFEGAPAGIDDPRGVAASGWDFESIDAGYRDYRKFAERILQNLRKSRPSRSRIQGILRDERQLWREAVRQDPLLPKALHPRGYEGPGSWKVRGDMLKRLRRAHRPGGRA
ncbi:MAG: hypothetical protein HKN82_18725 [Akkermansiaceae bacterium]|nr:hypothetical protein [Akkermansiaceae bacterium]